MISRIKKIWQGVCDILDGPKEAGILEPEDCQYWDSWPPYWRMSPLQKPGEKKPIPKGVLYIVYPRFTESRRRSPHFSDTLDVF